MSDPSLDVVRGTLELLVLKTLAAADRLHGFGILDWVRERSDDALILEEGALYPALHRMEKRGWLASEWGISEKGRRAKYYRLTAAGRRALTAESRRWERYVEMVSRLGARAGTS